MSKHAARWATQRTPALPHNRASQRRTRLGAEPTRSGAVASPCARPHSAFSAAGVTISTGTISTGQMAWNTDTPSASCSKPLRVPPSSAAARALQLPMRTCGRKA
eukprot:1171205-Prymnesium_polylepis.2